MNIKSIGEMNIMTNKEARCWLIEHPDHLLYSTRKKFPQNVYRFRDGCFYSRKQDADLWYDVGNSSLFRDADYDQLRLVTEDDWRANQNEEKQPVTVAIPIMEQCSELGDAIRSNDKDLLFNRLAYFAAAIIEDAEQRILKKIKKDIKKENNSSSEESIKEDFGDTRIHKFIRKLIEEGEKYRNIINDWRNPDVGHLVSMGVVEKADENFKEVLRKAKETFKILFEK